MKIVSVVGARPQFIKAASVSKELRQYHQEILVHTGQHYDTELSRIFFDELDIPLPYYNLGIGSDTHGKQTGNMIIAIEELLATETPDLVLLYGDTNSTLAGAIAAVKILIPVAHVEAGPRMWDKSIPEEVNRVLTDHISTLLFAPTSNTVDNLKKEGIHEGVYLTGDVMLDGFLHYSEVAERRSKILSELGLAPREYLFVTTHRARNTDDRENLSNIVEALMGIGETIVFPVHPRTLKFLKQYGLHDRLVGSSAIKLIAPVGYMDSIVLTKNAAKVITDSGGLQKEAYFAGVPCVTLDEDTCWPETLCDGWNILVGSKKERIIEAATKAMVSSTRGNWFGDGTASQKIATLLQIGEIAGRGMSTR